MPGFGSRRRANDQTATVHGYLIGAMPDAQKPNDKQLLLMEKIKNAQSSTKWAVLGVRQLLERAMATHLDAIRSLEADLEEDPETDTPVTAIAAGAVPLLLTAQKTDAAA